jgi:hypothetical protein
MTKDEIKDAERIHLNLIAGLSLITSGLWEMLRKKTDAPMRSQRNAQPLSEKTLLRLDKTLKKIEAVRDRAKNLQLTGGVSVMTLCDCPIHIESLRISHIISLEELMNSDPLNLLCALLNAEREGGERQYHLHLVAILNAAKIGRRINESAGK